MATESWELGEAHRAMAWIAAQTKPKPRNGKPEESSKESSGDQHYAYSFFVALFL